jgi:hypothetical protein
MGMLKGKQPTNTGFKSDFYNIEQFIKFVSLNKQKTTIIYNAERSGGSVFIGDKEITDIQTQTKSTKKNNSGILIVIDNTEAVFLDSLQFFDEWREVLNGVSSLLQGLQSNTLLTSNGIPCILNPAAASDLTKLLQDIELLKTKMN